jgi:uncharacterized protein YndB with AHSA1/START domain
MTHSEETIRIAAAPADVFAAVSDPRTHSEWRPSVVEFRADSQPVTVGTRIRETVRFLGRRYTTLFEVTRLDPPRTFAVRSLEGPLETNLRLEVAPADGGAELRFVMDLEDPRPLGLRVPGFQALMRWYLRDEGKRLGRLLESRPGSGSGPAA